MNAIFIILIILAGNFNDPANIAALEKQASADAENWKARLELIEIFLDQQNFAEAGTFLVQTQNIMKLPGQDTCNARYFYLWGLFWDLQDNIPMAMGYYSEATGCDSSYSQAWRNQAYLHEIFGNYDKMLFCLKKALLNTHDSTGVYYDIGVTYDYLDSIDEAIDSYYKALKIDKSDPQILLNLGADWGLQGSLDSAMAYFEKARQAGMEAAELDYNIGVIMSEKGLAEKAMEHFMQALAIDPDYCLAKYQLGKLYEITGDSGMARVYYEDFINTAPIIYLDNINEVKDKLKKYQKTGQK